MYKGIAVAGLLLALPAGVTAQAPNWTGPPESEVQYRADWYQCLRDAERSVPMPGQLGGDMYSTSLVMIGRAREVQNLTHACMNARGYETSAQTQERADAQGKVSPGEIAEFKFNQAC